MHNLLTGQYWFNLRPESLTPLAQKLFISGLILLVIIAIIVNIIKKRGGLYRRFFRKLYNFCWGNFFIGLLFLFFNYEQALFLSARFWLGLWGLTMLVWLIIILKKLKTIPIQKKQLAQAQELKKYLP